MSVNQLIFRNLKKNIKSYYLYVFALAFSAALYFAFVTLQYDPSMDAAKGTVKGGAAMKAASVLLVGIVSVFLVYANNIFIKRRSKEIGLFQLIGMTKGRIFRILTAENFLLYFFSLIIGVFVGFAASKLILMILFKVTGVEDIATLQFSSEALIQTLFVFAAIYLLIMAMNYFFIKSQSILSLFRVRSSSEERVKGVSIAEILVGILGMLLIAIGYYVSSKLFGGDFVTITELSIAMIFILASVIIGTYLFYRGSVTFIANLIRKSKGGYLNINEVLSLSSIMFRMKSNALLLTIITTVSALAIGLLSLSYISYYSAEKNAYDAVLADFSFINTEDGSLFKQALDENEIAFKEKSIEVVQADLDMTDIIDAKLEEGMNLDPASMPTPVISDKSVPGIDLQPNETFYMGLADLLNQFMGFKDSGNISIKTTSEEIPLTFLGIDKDSVIPFYFTGGGVPTAIVDDTVFQKVKENLDPELQLESMIYTGIDIKEKQEVEKANKLFNEQTYKMQADSLIDMLQSQKMIYGLTMFIVGFLGLTFLVTSGCILYFKQMDESEEEKANYTILRKLGFTQFDLLKGIQAKQLFNFGIPLLLGLLHSYFAVKSGWFFFGNELFTPMVIVMVLYTVLYSIFGILSVLYYKKVIKESL
ncbi:ABC transporter permease [Cytobacillus purgationiresistens]|uniref:Bacitracin transport system permease protein n=1 Tax=Cytobacillus purgationiresistens TaxID=863449 RepID=A0ABU0AKQ6_9BACI|nr:ABC transporter permease [Cytobacillus purgationiresistens]MDQ0271854.1 bacitracin transport system permease protein [Cytobacillus purgationiresistens]